MSMPVDALKAAYFSNFKTASKYESLDLIPTSHSDARKFWTKEVPSLGRKIEYDGLWLRFSIMIPNHPVKAFIFSPSPLVPNEFNIFLLDTVPYNYMDRFRLVERHFEIDLMNYVELGATYRILLGIVQQEEGCILGEITL